MSLGSKGEDIAEAYFMSLRYRILDRNWSVKNRGGKLIGEIDIIAEKGKDTVFVEVKSGRNPNPAYRSELHMTKSKMRKLERAGGVWLAQEGRLDTPWRIDLVAVDFSHDPPMVRHYKHTNNNE